MSDLLCVPCRFGWQVGISERRKLGRPSGAEQSGTNEGQPHLTDTLGKRAATGAGDTDTLKNLPPRGQEELGSAKLEETRRMSDLLCGPRRPG